MSTEQAQEWQHNAETITDHGRYQYALGYAAGRLDAHDPTSEPGSPAFASLYLELARYTGSEPSARELYEKWCATARRLEVMDERGRDAAGMEET